MAGSIFARNAFRILHRLILYVDAAAGNLLLIAFSAISAAFLYTGIGKDIKTITAGTKFNRTCPIFMPTTVASGFIMKATNEFYPDEYWIYLFPRSSYGLPGTRIGLPLIIGWLLRTGVTLSFFYLPVKSLKLRFLSHGSFHGWSPA